MTSVAGFSVDADTPCKRLALAKAAGICSKDYSPCSCTEQNVNCDQVSVRDIATMFNTMTWHDLNSIEITISPTETEPIPDDFLGYARVIGSVSLVCTENSYLQVSENAFRASMDSILTVTIRGCNLEKLNYAFMSKMKKLSDFFIFQSSEFLSFKGLPSHSNFKLLSITTSSGFASLDSTPVELAGLKSLYLNDNQLTDSEASALIKTLATTSVNSLIDFRLNDNKLTRIPDFLLSIPNLADLHLNNNAITSLSANSLAFRGPISISLGNNQIKSVRPGAFGSLRTLGTFGLIGLNLNKFNRLDSNAFQTLLEGMVIAGEGSLELGESKLLVFENS